MIKDALITYCIISLLVTLLILYRFAKKDIQRFCHPERYLNEKFGYNYKSRVKWAVLVLCLPGFNLVLIYLFASKMFSRKVQKTR